MFYTLQGWLYKDHDWSTDAQGWVYQVVSNFKLVIDKDFDDEHMLRNTWKFLKMFEKWKMKEINTNQKVFVSKTLLTKIVRQKKSES